MNHDEFLERLAQFNLEHELKQSERLRCAFLAIAERFERRVIEKRSREQGQSSSTPPQTDRED